jgi:hypothetical protein
MPFEHTIGHSDLLEKGEWHLRATTRVALTKMGVWAICWEGVTTRDCSDKGGGHVRDIGKGRPQGSPVRRKGRMRFALTMVVIFLGCRLLCWLH